MITSHNVDVNTAMGTPQFYLLWLVLALNVTAGIGILEQASPMIQDLFHGQVIGGGRRRFRRRPQPVQYGRPFHMGLHARTSSAANRPT